MTENSYAEKQICDRLPLLRRYVISRFKGPTAQAEDICGQAILKIMKTIRNGKFKNGYSIDAFMRKCAWAEINDYCRNRDRLKRTRNNEYEYHFNMTTKSPEKEYEIRMENNAFMEGVKGLRDVYRKIIILVLFQNMRHYEIAEVLDIPRTTVSTHFLRIRRKLGNIHLNKVRIRAGK